MRAMTWARVFALSLLRMWWTCLLMVVTETPNRPAMSRLLGPQTISNKTSRSRRAQTALATSIDTPLGGPGVPHDRKHTPPGVWNARAWGVADTIPPGRAFVRGLAS